MLYLNEFINANVNNLVMILINQLVDDTINKSLNEFFKRVFNDSINKLFVSFKQAKLVFKLRSFTKLRNCTRESLV